MQERVAAELWDFYTCDPGFEEKASTVIHTRCMKLVKDMHYEAQIQCVVNYGAIFLHKKITKKGARNFRLTQEQYLQVPAWWCRNGMACWERTVAKWFTPEWQEKHNAGRERRLLMRGPSHHQGSMSNEEYRARWSVAHGSAECPEFMGWALARKGKASEVTYNPEDPPSAYSNPSVHSRMTIYTEVGRQMYGPDWDPVTQPIDPEVVMQAGQGKKHGRFVIGDGTIDTANAPTLAQVRARTTERTGPVRPREPAALLQVQALQVLSDLFIAHSISTYICFPL
ncbi:unnamed protein product [Urochloa humidicola]